VIKSDMQGSIKDISIPSVLQLMAWADSVTRLDFHNGSQNVSIYVQGKNLYHLGGSLAVDLKMDAQEVFFQLLQWETGRFSAHRGVDLPQRTLNVNWEYLLLECLRRLDEGGEAPSLEDSEAEERFIDELFSDFKEDLLMEDGQNDKPHEIQEKGIEMSNIQKILEESMEINGAIAAALVDWQSGLTLGTIGTGMNIELAAAGNTNVVRAKLGVMKDLQIKGGIEDILITLTDQIHIIRLLKSNKSLFLYLALSKNGANLGLARHRLAGLEDRLQV